MAYKNIENAKDILELNDGDTIGKSSLYSLIVHSKIYGSSAYLGSIYEVKNTPQQGINWIGDDISPLAVIVKSKAGNYFQDSRNEYAFKARNGIVNKYEKANQVLINQKKYGYPIMYFVEAGYGDWKLLGRFSVIEIKDRSVVLSAFNKKSNDDNKIIEPKKTSNINNVSRENVFPCETKQTTKTVAILIKKCVKNDWPKWELPTEDETFQLAKICTKYIRFLSPVIVQKIVENNESLRARVCEKLESKGINSELYFWEKSSCCFPGIRRYAGSSEISAYRKRSEINFIEDALALDDNDYPKQIWSFIFRGSQFSKFGPTGYSLAHLVDHKKDKNRMEEEFSSEDKNAFEKPFYGLYTCATNSVFIPNNLMKPTDFNGQIRNLLFRKAESLYGSFCNLVPTSIKLNKNTDNKWNINNFDWAEPVGTTDNIDAFLKFRKNKLELLFET